MVFNSLEFAFFLFAVFFLYWFSFPHYEKSQNLILLVASTVFYCVAEWKFVFLLFISGIANFYLAQYLAGIRKESNRRIILISGITANAGILFYFKYFNFFIESFNNLLYILGINSGFSSLLILLPLGISFYTFQMIGYLIDVHNEEIAPSDDLLVFMTYVTYFPKILSGPIERYQVFTPKILKRRDFDYDISVDGLRQILWGLFKKVVLADNLTLLVNYIFEHSDNMGGSTLLLGSVFYLLSVYTDFSGYSDMACGVSKLFNIRITNNFSFPFFSTNISSFWKKWHISLTSWMMDYIFTPLNFVLRGYRTKGLIFSVLITFLVVGLWHGANWTFVIFGVLQGLFFIPLILRGNFNKDKMVARGRILPNLNEIFLMSAMFLLMSLSFVFLRSDTFGQAFRIISGILSPSLFSIPEFQGKSTALIVFIISLIVFFIEWSGRDQEYGIAKFGYGWKTFWRWSFYCALLIAIFYFGGKEQQYIYFQF